MSDLLGRIPGRQGQLVSLACEIAQQQRRQTFLVGGPLRDLLLGRPLQDLDFTLESGAEEFARELADRAGGTLRSYPQFLTHKIEFPGMPPIDVATTRREEYPRPGSLPVVTPSGLLDDLRRRDFTINAMALEIVTQRLRDPFEGGADLRERLIRALHELSFSDDPTRLYRALRLAVRLQFRIEPRTREWMQEAMDRAFAGTVSRQRLWREFFLALGEAARARVLYEFAAAGALRTLLGKSKFADDLLPGLENADRLLRRFGGDAAVTFLAVLLESRPLRKELAAGSGLTRIQLEKIQSIGEALPDFGHKLREAGSEGQRFDLCRDVPHELILLCAAQDPDLEAMVGRYLEYRSLELGVRGDELEVPSGPHIGRALERTRKALFFGEITRAEARAFARRVALEYLEGNAS